jgi:hypothetical protein
LLREVLILALAWSISITICVVAYGRGELAWSVRDGQAAWLNWLGPVVDLARGWPSFFWQLTPGVVNTEVPFAIHVVLWTGTIALVLAAAAAAGRRLPARVRPAIVAGAVLVAVMAFVQVGWLVNGVDGLDPARSQLRALAAISRGAPAAIVAAFTIQDGAAAASMIVARAEAQPRFQSVPPIGVFPGVPPGSYDVTISVGRPRSGELIVRDGRRELARAPLVSLSEQTVALPLPQGATLLVFELDGADQAATVAMRVRRP